MHSLQEVCYQYWPAGKRTQSYGEFSVELVNEERKRGFILRTLSVQQAKVHKRRTRGDLVLVYTLIFLAPTLKAAYFLENRVPHTSKKMTPYD